ncbi:tRNA uridine-5-carboxymethylaminomethyl(34) synthesis GTPase MnmE, partial [candidate division KSB1 bacterium]|nr:tRNA uridine-5-carboxymethylaminomethyl(34) synthesis GTPase MnmE [candidate division KSB1 bacterium]
MSEEDTIAALATPIGSSGIAVVRVSGPNAIPLVANFFRGSTSLPQCKPWRVYLGKIVVVEDGKEILVDQVLITVFKAPQSYTGEDSVEISCHGGIYVSNVILKYLYLSGARPAQPGEFTFRAFMNGRLDLTQAEAVADLIRARSMESLKASAEQLEGSL